MLEMLTNEIICGPEPVSGQSSEQRRKLEGITDERRVTKRG